MAEYFTSRGLPVPRELARNPLTDWRRLGSVAAVLVVLFIGFRIVDVDLSRANPPYMAGVLRQLVDFDFSVLWPHGEFLSLIHI